jgi:hypothetical protein
MITKNATASLVVGAVMGVGISTIIGPAQATSRSEAQARKPAAAVTVSGDRGRYLEFTGVESAFGTYAGRLKFRRPVTTGKYTLVVTFTPPAGRKSRIVYDITARQR